MQKIEIIYEVDIWKEIAERNNLELNYTISSDVAGLFTMLDTGKIDTILCCLLYTSKGHTGSAFHGILVSTGRTKTTVTAERNKF